MLLHIDKYDIQNFTKGLKKNYDPSAGIPFIEEVSEMPENISLNALKDLVQKNPYFERFRSLHSVNSQKYYFGNFESFERPLLKEYLLY